MKIVVLGATGMLGYQVFRHGLKRGLDIYGTVRNKSLILERIGDSVIDRLHDLTDAKNFAEIEELINRIRPDYVVNCIGIIKQSPLAEDPYESIAINSYLPHQLQKSCNECGGKLIHISTDCVFDGKSGFYKETDPSNALDLYGKTKYLGEVGYGCGVTLRTSIIGHEITEKKYGLLEWFLSQRDKTQGFTKAIFSGLTTLELANVIFDVVIPASVPAGIFQVASTPISKYELIRIIAEVYGLNIEIEPSEKLEINRSLDGSKFVKRTGYEVPSWPSLIENMKRDFNQGF